MITIISRRALAIAALVLASTTSGCTGKASLQQLSDARRLSADLVVHFTTAADAANRAVMADTDEASAAFAREANQALQDVQQDAESLRPILQALAYAEEMRQLEAFERRFEDYRALDRTILALAVEPTNVTLARSPRHPDVRSLALTLNQKGQRTRACLETLDALRDALSTRRLGGTR